jgi:alpha-L-fucosidase
MAPKPDGSVEESQKILFSQMGDWMKIYGESVYGTEGGPYLPEKGDFVSTRKGDKIYLHLLSGQNFITLPSHDKKILSAKIFPTAQAVKIEKFKDKNIFHVPGDYKNENDVIIELQIKGATADMALIPPTEN